MDAYFMTEKFPTCNVQAYVLLLTYDLYYYYVKASDEVRSSHHPQRAVSGETLRRKQLS